MQVNAAAAAENIPVVLVLCNGGILSIDSLVAGSSAIIEAFNPVDHGTKAVAEYVSCYDTASRECPPLLDTIDLSLYVDK